MESGITSDGALGTIFRAGDPTRVSKVSMMPLKKNQVHRSSSENGTIQTCSNLHLPLRY